MILLNYGYNFLYRAEPRLQNTTLRGITCIMSEFSHGYTPVTYETHSRIPVDAGIALAGIGMIRPLGFTTRQHGHPYMLATIDDSPRQELFSLRGEDFPGLIETLGGIAKPIDDGIARVSFRYYKESASGGPEEIYRDIEI